MSVKSLKNEDIFLVKLDNDKEKDELVNAVSNINNGDDTEVDTTGVVDTTNDVQTVDNTNDLQDIDVGDIVEIDSEEPLIEDIEDSEGGMEGYLDNDIDDGELPTDLVSMDGIVEVDSDPLETLPVIDNDGPLFALAMQAMVDYHNIAVLHHNLIGGAWLADHENLGDYYDYMGNFVDDIIEQNIELGGREPSIAEAVSACGCINIVNRDKNESYNIVKGIFNCLVTMIEEVKSSVPGDVISTLENYQNYFRKEADYKLKLTVRDTK